MILAMGLGLHSTLEPAPTRGDVVLLDRAVANLVDNAVLHNHAGGTLRIRSGVHAGQAFLEVENSGPLIPEEVVPRLFERFRRLQERTGSRPGFGVGLSIVASVMTAHQGTVQAHSRPGGGLVIRIELAADPDAPPSAPEG